MTLRLTAFLALVLLSGCATVGAPQLVDPQNRDYSQKVIDQRRCLVVTSYFHGVANYDTDYYYACMDKKGYKLEAAK